MNAEPVQDIEDLFLGDVSEEPRKAYKDHSVKRAKNRKKEAQPKEEKEYEPSTLFKK